MAFKEFPAVRPGRGWITIPEMIERSGQEFRDRVALQMRRKDGWVRYTYGEVLDRVKRLAAALKALGLKKGDRASVVGENRPEWAISYLAISWAGGIVVPLDARLKPTEHRHILMDAESKIVIGSQGFIEDLLEIQKDLETLEHVISMDPGTPAPSLHDLWAQYTEGVPREPVELEDLAVILYTSGTTGSSKGVMLTHKNIMSNVDAIYQIIDYGPGDQFFSILPMHHVFEATAGFLAPLYNGTTITYARSLKPNEMQKDMKETGTTVMLVVPLLLEKIARGIQRELKKASPVKKGLFYGLKGTSKVLDIVLRGKARKALFRSIRDRIGFGKIRYLVSGGAALPRWVSKFLEDLGFPILQGYGLSETAPVLTVNPPCCPRNESVGLPIPGVQIKIVDPRPDDGVGEIAAKGPNVMKGYYKNPKATAEVFTEDGWFLTGDLGYFDKDGYLYITGRKKSVIVTKGGKNIYPEEIENHLLQSDFIEEVLVLRGYNPRTGDEEVHAIVYPNFEALDTYFKAKGIEAPTEEDVREVIGQEIDRLCADLADYKRVRRFTIRDEEFPKTTTRKIKRYLFESEAIPVQHRQKP